MKRTADISPLWTARIAGVLYMITIGARIVADAMVRDPLVRSSDAGATATNILAHDSLYLSGFVADLIAFASYLALTALLHDLLERVNRRISLAAVLFSVAACIAQAVSSLFHLAPRVLLGDPQYGHAFTTEQLHALALFCLRLRALLYHNVGLVFLGLYLILIGVLAFRSGFLPRALGVLVLVAGLAYVPFVWPPLARRLLPYILIPAAAGQISLALWLVVRGLNLQRWMERGTPAPGTRVG